MGTRMRSHRDPCQRAMRCRDHPGTGNANFEPTKAAHECCAAVSQADEGPDMMLPEFDRQRREKQSKRNRGLPGWSSGFASEGRRLAGAEMEARAHALGAVVSGPREVSLRKAAKATGVSKSSIHKALAVPAVSHKVSHKQKVGQQPERSRDRAPPVKSFSRFARWQHLRLKSQARLFDIDRPDRVGTFP
jgi:hypothetical protein